MNLAKTTLIRELKKKRADYVERSQAEPLLRVSIEYIDNALASLEADETSTDEPGPVQAAPE